MTTTADPRTWLRDRGVPVAGDPGPACLPIDLPRDTDGRVDVSRLVDSGHGTVLESHPDVPGTGNWSYVVVDAGAALRHDQHTTRLVAADGEVDLGPDAFQAIDRLAAACRWGPDDPLGDVPDGVRFAGGLVGTFAYDLGRLVEALPGHAIDDRSPAWLDLVVATGVVAIDHRTEDAWLLTRAGDPVARAADLVADAHATPRRQVRATHAADGTPVVATSSLDRPAYLAAVRQVLDHVAAGETFQVNVAQRFTVPWAGDDVDLYLALRHESPAPHLALHRCADGSSVLSVSPETFLAANGRHVHTRPIKGTRPRHADDVTDRRARRDLATSDKEQAENVMVVDMERNDLGRVCEPGSVRVPELLHVEGHPTVWQMVSTVEGRLVPGAGWGSLLRATFPCGSVTGTPKVRAMQVIDTLEPVRRGWYCGAVGWLGPGSASLSVAIRTAVLDDGRADYAAGGGIVADSDPGAEYDETLAKALAFFRATGSRPA